MILSLETASDAIIQASKRLDSLNLCPATGGNYSHRLDSDSLLVTVSGCLKGSLTPDDLIRYSVEGKALEDKKPSAEALLHAVIYELYPHIDAVLHTHSVGSVVYSRYYHDKKTADFYGYEMQKTMPSCHTHDMILSIPIFDNSQDMNVLAWQMRDILTPQDYAFIVRGHGIYGWGKNMIDALRAVEGLEYLIACELEMLKLPYVQTMK